MVTQRLLSIHPVIEGEGQKKQGARRKICSKPAVIQSSTEPYKWVSLNRVEIIKDERSMKGVPIGADSHEQQDCDRKEPVAQHAHT